MLHEALGTFYETEEDHVPKEMGCALKNAKSCKHTWAWGDWGDWSPQTEIL